MVTRDTRSTGGETAIGEATSSALSDPVEIAAGIADLSGPRSHRRPPERRVKASLAGGRRAEVTPADPSRAGAGAHRRPKKSVLAGAHGAPVVVAGAVAVAAVGVGQGLGPPATFIPASSENVVQFVAMDPPAVAALAPSAPAAAAGVESDAGAQARAQAAIGRASADDNSTHRAASIRVQPQTDDGTAGEIPAEVALERAARASRMRAREALEDRREAAEERREAAAAEKKAKEKRAERARQAAEAREARAKRAAALANAYSLPVRGYRLSAHFGQSGSRWSRNHTGLDFACPSGTPVRAVAAGTVVSTRWDGSYGWKTVIRHADGVETWYAHQSSFVVRRGQVSPGQIIGRVGSTGNSTGPHLHLEVRVNGNPVDPRAWLQRHGLRP